MDEHASVAVPASLLPPSPVPSSRILTPGLSTTSRRIVRPPLDVRARVADLFCAFPQRTPDTRGARRIGITLALIYREGRPITATS